MPRAAAGGPRKVRYAVVGLGYISQVAMLPAFKGAARNSVLAALVSGDRRKLKALGEMHGVARRVRYEDYDDLLRSGEIDAVYIGLPNSLHRDYAARAARAGIHVLCDKPLGPNAADCAAIIDAAAAAGVRLMTAYRLHFEPANLETAALARAGTIGKARCLTAQFAMQLRRGNIRAKRELGGGPLLDIGVYCINAARHVFAAEPAEVLAQAATGDDPRFDEVEEMAAVQLRFPGERLASFVVSFGVADVSAMQIWGSGGSIRLDAAFDMAGEKHVTIETVRGGKTRKIRRRFANRDQFAPLLLEFSAAILERRDPFPDGREGLADIRVVDAIYRSIAEGRAIPLPPLDPAPREALPPRRAKGVRAHAKPELVGAKGPSA